MADEQEPFADIIVTEDGFSLPTLKWRELLFIGAVRAEGPVYVRDPSRPLPPFRIPDLFREGCRFEVLRGVERVRLKRV